MLRDTTIRIGTIPEKMMYDVRELTVKPGKNVKLAFANFDFMPHDIMLVSPGKADEIGVAAVNPELRASMLDLCLNLPTSSGTANASTLVRRKSLSSPLQSRKGLITASAPFRDIIA